MRPSPSLLLLMMSALVLCVAAPAQTTSSTHRRPILPLQFGPVVKNAPVSAIRVLDFTPATGVDAEPIHGEERFFRDSLGRTRSEIRYGTGPTTIYLLDHSAHVELTWRDGETEGRRLPLKEYPVAETKTASYTDDSPRIESIPTVYRRTQGRADATETIESWYSAELQLTLATVIDTPGWGKTSYRYTKIDRKEPDRTLFAAPIGGSMQVAGTPPTAPVLLADHSASGTATTSAGVAAASTAPRPAYLSDPKFQKAYDEARNSRATAEEHAALWKKAVKLSDETCIECLKRLITYQNTMGAYKDVQRSAEQLDKVATLPADQELAKLTIGQALMKGNFGQPKRAEIEQAEAAFRAVLLMAPRSKVAIYEEGLALAKLGRDDEAKAQFQRYLELTSDADRYHLRAAHYVQNPHLATLPSAPPFRLVSAQGEEIELDDMHGKVVLLDFWATWCGPCKESLPEIQRIAKDFKDEPLVVISISSDQDAAAWKKFIQDHDMDWPQYRDTNGALSRAYNVNSIPHYFTIDSDGVLQTEAVGAGANIRGKLKKLVARAREASDHAQSAGQTAR